MKALSTRQSGMAALVVVLLLASIDWKEDSPKGKKSAALIAEATDHGKSRSLLHHVPEVLAVADVSLNKLGERVESDEDIIDVFSSKSWFVPPLPPPPAPPPKPVPSPPPTAPPLPFTFIGSYQEPNGHLIIFLSKGDRVLSVSPGDILENTYRVDGISAGQLGLTYLPLNIKQTMSIGEAS